MKVAVFSPFQMNKPSPHTTSIASVSASSASPAAPNTPTPTATPTPTTSSSPSSSSSSSSSSSTYNPIITTSATTTSPTKTMSASTMATTTTTTTMTTLGKVRPSHSPRVSPYPAPAASVPLGLGSFDLPVALNSSSASSGGQTIATLDAGSLSPPGGPQRALSLTADASEESEIARVTPTNPFSSSELAETERTGSPSPKSSRSSSPALLMEEAKQKGAAASAGGQKVLLAGERTPWCLIVDDNDVNLEVLRHNLNKYGIPFNVAKNGEVALEYACKHTYKFIIMDICMPGMDGFQSTIKIRNEERSLNKDTSIIAHTTLQNPLAYFRDRGLNDLLTKPFNKEDLLRILRTYAFAE